MNLTELRRPLEVYAYGPRCLVMRRTFDSFGLGLGGLGLGGLGLDSSILHNISFTGKTS